jgi:hypothetical protein
MGDFVQRQADILSAAIVDFEASRISLGALVHRIEEVGAIVESQTFRDRLRELIICLEQINAATLEGAAISTRSEGIVRVGLEQLRDAISELRKQETGLS